MLRKKIIGFAIGLAVIGVGAIVFTTFFEIVPDETYVLPSREAQENDFLALDRWLASDGITVRAQNYASPVSLMTAEENVIMIQSDLVDWNADVISSLDSRVEAGGRLILSLDYWHGWDENDALGSYLQGLGIEYSGKEPDWDSPDDSDYYGPDFFMNVYFSEPANARLVLKDAYGFIRLVQIEKGAGTITVMGWNYLMTNDFIKDEANARLCWYLFSGGKSNSVFFVRGERPFEDDTESLYGHGNFYMIVIAGLVLIAVGFWAAIPVFGVVRGDEKNGKPLAERFLAEGRFLRRFNSLDVYRSVYIKQIKRKLAKRNFHDDDENAKRARKILADYEENAATESAAKKRPLAKNEFVKSITVWKTILERL